MDRHGKHLWDMNTAERETRGGHLATMSKVNPQGITVLKTSEYFSIEDTPEFREKYKGIRSFLLRRKGRDDQPVVVAMSQDDDFVKLENAFLESFPAEEAKLSTEYEFQHGPGAFQLIISAQREAKESDVQGRLK